MSRPEVTLATPAIRERAVATVVAAFRDDPAFRHFFPDETSYAEQAAAFAEHLFDRRVARATVWSIDGGAAVSMWDSPAGAGGEDQRPGLPADSLERLAAFDAAVHTALPAEPHWYLGVVATHPAFAGRRWGRAVMAAGLREAARAGLPACLETANPGNVGLYRRAGWDVVGSLTVDGLRVWVMRHPARGPVSD